MRCSEFRDLHAAYVDDTLAGVELVRMQRHMSECPPCAELDARIRRALLLVRNLPTIEPSPDFARRLEARLARARATEEQRAALAGSFRTVATVGALASVAMLAYVAQGLRTPAAPDDVVGRPVAVSVSAGAAGAFTPVDLLGPLPRASHDVPIAHHRARLASVAQPSVAVDRAVDDGSGATQSAQAIVASVAAGVPIWPVALLAEPGTAHFASFTTSR